MEVKYRDIAQDIARKAVDGSLDLDEFNALVEEQRRELIRKRDHLVVKDETYELIQKLPEYRQHYKGPVKKIWKDYRWMRMLYTHIMCIKPTF